MFSLTSVDSGAIIYFVKEKKIAAIQLFRLLTVCIVFVH